MKILEKVVKTVQSNTKLMWAAAILVPGGLVIAGTLYLVNSAYKKIRKKHE